MSPKDVALLYHHPLLKAFFYWDATRYHCAHYLCHVIEQRESELGRQELVALIDHYMRMSASDMVQEMEHVEPCDYCDPEQLFRSRDRRTYERAA